MTHTTLPTATITRTPTPRGPELIAGMRPGSTTVGGGAERMCPPAGSYQCFPSAPCPDVTPVPCDRMIHVFDCGADRICYTCDDVQMGLPVTKDSITGAFDFHLVEPLRSGQTIYARDDCFDPLLNGIGDGPAWGPPARTWVAAVPVLSRDGLALAIGLLIAVGAVAFARRRARRGDWGT